MTEHINRVCKFLCNIKAINCRKELLYPVGVVIVKRKIFMFQISDLNLTYLVEVITTCLQDAYPKILRPRRGPITVIICIILFLLGLPCVTGVSTFFRYLSKYSEKNMRNKMETISSISCL